jgi:hypothetical protein
MKFFEMIKEIVEKLFKKSEGTPSDSPVEKVEIEPKLTVSDKDPSGGKDRDVWIKYEGVE